MAGCEASTFLNCRELFRMMTLNRIANPRSYTVAIVLHYQGHHSDSIVLCLALLVTPIQCVWGKPVLPSASPIAQLIDR